MPLWATTFGCGSDRPRPGGRVLMFWPSGSGPAPNHQREPQAKGQSMTERARDHLSAVPDPPSDPAALLGEVAKGSETAFATLYDLVAPRVYGLVRRVLRDPAQAEEVAQEVLVEVW